MDVPACNPVLGASLAASLFPAYMRDPLSQGTRQTLHVPLWLHMYTYTTHERKEVNAHKDPRLVPGIEILNKCAYDFHTNLGNLICILENIQN